MEGHATTCDETVACEFGEVSSAMQKAIRRADAKLAGYWALELWESGFGQYVWRRLLTVSAEVCQPPPAAALRVALGASSLAPLGCWGDSHPGNQGAPRRLHRDQPPRTEGPAARPHLFSQCLRIGTSSTCGRRRNRAERTNSELLQFAAIRVSFVPIRVPSQFSTRMFRELSANDREWGKLRVGLPAQQLL